MQIILFEDAQTSRLFPITIGRAAYDITCGSYRLIDWALELAGEYNATLDLVVRPHLAELQRVEFATLFTAEKRLKDKHPGAALLLNARLVPSATVANTLRQLIQFGQPALVKSGSCVCAAFIPPAVSQPAVALPRAPVQSLGVEGFWDFVEQQLSPALPVQNLPLPLLEYPHDLIRQHLQILDENLAHRIQSGRYRQIADGVFAAEGAVLAPHTVCDTSKGPVILDEGATVGPHSFLRGPVYLGQRCRVIEQSAIKDKVSLGHTTKIGGEVEASIVEPFTNKQHYGFLGHSYLGSWINLGAGTCNSDLKNTYGQVKMEYRGESVATNMQFVGCIMGDYAKSAINTGIFTGKTIGVCSMVYGFVTTNVPSFVNYARLFGQVTELPPEVMISTQQRMFARRNVTQRECDINLIHAMYELTRHERQIAGEPLSL